MEIPSGNVSLIVNQHIDGTLTLEMVTTADSKLVSLLGMLTGMGSLVNLTPTLLHEESKSKLLVRLEGVRVGEPGQTSADITPESNRCTNGLSETAVIMDQTIDED